MPETETPVLDPDGPYEEVNQRVVDKDKDQEDAKVLPRLRRVDIQRPEVIVPTAEGTVLTISRCPGVQQASTCLSSICPSV